MILFEYEITLKPPLMKKKKETKKFIRYELLHIGYLNMNAQK